MSRLGRRSTTPLVIVAAFFGLLVITALLPWLTGRDPAYAVLRAREREREATPELIDAIRRAEDLPSTPWESLAQWFSGLLRLDFGNSWVDTRVPALSAALDGIGITAALTTSALAFALILAALTVALHVRRRLGHDEADNGIAGQVLAAWAALPDFVVAVLLLWWFAVQWQLLPVGGWASPAHMVLPTIALGLSSAGMYGRVLLISADAALSEPWVQSWRSNGVAQSTLICHVLWRAFLPTASQLALFFAGVISSTAAIEVTFNINGFGRTVVESATRGDIPVLQAAVTFVLLLGIGTGVVAHVLHSRVTRRLSGSQAHTQRRRSADARQHRFGDVALSVAAVPLLLVLAGIGRSSEINSSQRFAAPSLAHPLGADQLGRDIWARLADGFFYTIGAAVLVTFACGLIGLVLGHLGTWVQHLGDAMNALPSILLGLVLAGVFGRSMMTAAIAVLLVGWIPLAAHCAAVVSEVSRSGHYQYAAMMGANRWHLLKHHVLPTTIPAVARHAVGRIAHNAIALAALGFLGVGAAVGSPDWGVILNEAAGYLERAPWMALGPMIALVSLGVTATIATDRHVAR